MWKIYHIKVPFLQVTTPKFSLDTSVKLHYIVEWLCNRKKERRRMEKNWCLKCILPHSDFPLHRNNIA